MTVDPDPQGDDPKNNIQKSPIPQAAVDAFDSGARAYLAGDNPTAVEQLDRAATEGGDFPEAEYMLGLAQLRAGDREAGVAALQAVAASSASVMLRDYAVKKLARLAAEQPRPQG
jgi:hypothetical protein